MGKWKALVDADLAMTTAIYKTLGPVCFFPAAIYRDFDLH
jgi:hypothetical protein